MSRATERGKQSQDLNLLVKKTRLITRAPFNQQNQYVNNQPSQTNSLEERSNKSSTRSEGRNTPQTIQNTRRWNSGFVRVCHTIEPAITQSVRSQLSADHCSCQALPASTIS